MSRLRNSPTTIYDGKHIYLMDMRKFTVICIYAIQSITKGHLFMVHMMGSHKVFKIAYQGMYFTL